MSSIPQIATALQTVMTEVANTAARETGLIQRERAMSGAQFVQTLVLGWLANLMPHMMTSSRWLPISG